jgi:hypothetical protein
MLIQAILENLSGLNEQEILNPNLTINDIIVGINNLEVLNLFAKY